LDRKQVGCDQLQIRPSDLTIKKRCAVICLVLKKTNQQRELTILCNPNIYFQPITKGMHNVINHHVAAAVVVVVVVVVVVCM
jgi:hypothetical protein